MDQENCISSAFSHLYTDQEATEFVKLSSFIVHHVDARWAIVPSAEPVRPQCTLIPYGHVCLRCFCTCISVQMFDGAKSFEHTPSLTHVFFVLLTTLR